MDEKFGTIIIDGKLVNLDTAPIEELNKYINRLEKKEDEIRNEIDELLKKRNINID